MSQRLACVLLLAFSGCVKLTEATVNQLTSFKVEVRGVYLGTGETRTPLNVVTSCVKKYGSQELVPLEARGTAGCKYEIPRSEIEIDLVAQAMDLTGEPLRDFNSSVAFRVVPGELAASYATRWAFAQDGKVTATVRSKHQYGQVRVWVEDAPAKPIYDGGEQAEGALPDEVGQRRTYAAGASDILYFDEQTLQSLQQPDGFDNRSSPFVGEFVTLGKNPESGETLRQSCTDDPARDGQPALMVITGLDQSGFFVTDVSACRLVEKTSDATGTQVRTPQLPEPCLAALSDGGTQVIEGPDAGTGTCEISLKRCTSPSDCNRYLPGTFGSMFVYNYTAPDALNRGDLIFTLSGSVQEFTSTTQMVFPGWTVAERVRQLPPDQWEKWLQYAPPTTLGGRLCGWDDVPGAYITDQLCGHNRRNLKMESLESGLVRLRHARFPQTFENCDFNGDRSVPFFCETRDRDGNWSWGSCAVNEVEPESDRVERECAQACVLASGAHAGQICSETSAFQSFGQFVVELGMPGLASAGLDDSLPQRSTRLAVPARVGSADGGVPQGTTRAQGYGQGTQVAIACDADVHYRVGDNNVTAEPTDPLVRTNQWVGLTFGAQQSAVAFLSAGSTAVCTVGVNVQARLNVYTASEIPELAPNCSPTDPDPAKATQCLALRAATFDIVGHLKQVQPARPRWMVVPRDVDDVCCHPRGELDCPKPIKRCTTN